MTTAYSYTRFSHPDQVISEKTASQLCQARKFAEENSLILDENYSFQDLGVSGYHGANSEFGRLADFLTAIRTGIIESGSYLLVESLDRISRQTARKAFRVLEDICDEGITVVTLIDGQQYNSVRLNQDPTALLISIIIFVRANEESLTKSNRIREAWKRKLDRARKDKTQIITKVTPNWINLKNNKFFIDKERVKAVRLIFKLAEVGVNPAAIASVLNLNKIPCPKGGDVWYRHFVHEILKSPAAIGWHVPHSYNVINGKRVKTPCDPIKGYFPRVVSKKTWEKVQGHIEARTQKYKILRSLPKRQIRNIFGRLAKCSNCGLSMARRNTIIMPATPKDRVWGLICEKSSFSEGCKFNPIPYEPIEEMFFKEAPTWLNEHCKSLKKSQNFDKNNFNKHELKIFEAKVKEVCNTIEMRPLDRKCLNTQLRRLFKRMVVNYKNEVLDFEFIYGGKLSLPFGECLTGDKFLRFSR